jgi:hypothetical protein
MNTVLCCAPQVAGIGLAASLTRRGCWLQQARASGDPEPACKVQRGDDGGAAAAADAQGAGGDAGEPL